MKLGQRGKVSLAGCFLRCYKAPGCIICEADKPVGKLPGICACSNSYLPPFFSPFFLSLPPFFRRSRRVLSINNHRSKLVLKLASTQNGASNLSRRSSLLFAHALYCSHRTNHCLANKTWVACYRPGRY